MDMDQIGRLAAIQFWQALDELGGVPEGWSVSATVLGHCPELLIHVWEGPRRGKLHSYSVALREWLPDSPRLERLINRTTERMLDQVRNRPPIMRQDYVD